MLEKHLPWGNAKYDNATEPKGALQEGRRMYGLSKSLDTSLLPYSPHCGPHRPLEVSLPSSSLSRIRHLPPPRTTGLAFSASQPGNLRKQTCGHIPTGENYQCLRNHRDSGDWMVPLSTYFKARVATLRSG